MQRSEKYIVAEVVPCLVGANSVCTGHDVQALQTIFAQYVLAEFTADVLRW